MKDDIVKAPQATKDTNATVANNAMESSSGDLHKIIDPVTSSTNKTDELPVEQAQKQEKPEDNKQKTVTQTEAQNKAKNRDNTTTVAIVLAAVCFLGLAGLAIFTQIQ